MPTTTEWSATSRWEGSSAISADAYEYPVGSGNWWTSGDYASGDVTDYTVNPDPYAWYDANSSKTNAVNGKAANALGIYDMSHNVLEWNFNLQPGMRTQIARGGSFGGISLGLQVGRWYDGLGLRDLFWTVGFRIGKNSD